MPTTAHSTAMHHHIRSGTDKNPRYFTFPDGGHNTSLIARPQHLDRSRRRGQRSQLLRHPHGGRRASRPKGRLLFWGGR